MSFIPTHYDEISVYSGGGRLRVDHAPVRFICEDPPPGGRGGKTVYWYECEGGEQFYTYEPLTKIVDGGGA